MFCEKCKIHWTTGHINCPMCRTKLVTKTVKTVNTMKHVEPATRPMIRSSREEEYSAPRLSSDYDTDDLLSGTSGISDDFGNDYSGGGGDFGGGGSDGDW